MRNVVIAFAAATLWACSGSIEEPPTEGASVVVSQDGSVVCAPGAFEVRSLEQIAARFTLDVYPLLVQPQTGCLGCHDATTERRFKLGLDGVGTFHLARAAGQLEGRPGGLLHRLATADSTLLMPRGAPRWSTQQLEAAGAVVCELESHRLGPDAVAPDEEFPPHLELPYTGPRPDYWDDTFVDWRQLQGRVKTVFGDDWVRDGVDRFAERVGLFGGVDFVRSFVPARTVTSDFMLGLDALAEDVCSAAAAQANGPFTGIDTRAELVDAPPPQTTLLQAEAMPEKAPNSYPTSPAWGWRFHSAGFSTAPVTFPAAGRYNFTVRARGGTAAMQSPVFELRVDGMALQQVTVWANLADHIFTGEVGRGTLTLAVGLLNPLYDPGPPAASTWLEVDFVRVEGPVGGGGTGLETAARAAVERVYSRMLYRAPLAGEGEAAYRLLADLTAQPGGASVDAWSGLCEALLRHPDFLFTLPPAYDDASGAERERLLLVKVALDLVARPPTAVELDALASGSVSFDTLVDRYLESAEFRDYYFYLARLRTESDGTPDGDEPARLWTQLAIAGQPFQRVLDGDYAVTSGFEATPRPSQHGRTGLLSMKGFIAHKPGLPHFNYPARVLGDLMGYVFTVPQEAFEARGTATAASTVDPHSVCFSCHQLLTPLAYQRLRWADDGTYRTADEHGAPLDDSDRGLVEGYPYPGSGLEAFSVRAARKESFVRQTLNAHFSHLFDRPMRHGADERGLYRALWDESRRSNGSLKAIIKAIIASKTYRHENAEGGT